MDIIPFITLQKQKILGPSPQQTTPFNTFLQQIQPEQTLYIYDLDGIEKNKPNLSLYNDLADHNTLWVDSGPRTIDDILDIVMAGATNLTIRTHLWPTYNIQTIKEYTENPIYLYYDHTDTLNIHDSIPPSVGDGIILFNINNILLQNTPIQTLFTKHSTYIYEPDPHNYTHWKNTPIKGLLINHDHYKEANP